MIWHLVAVLVMGLSMGGVAFFLVKSTRGKLPRWLIPAFAATGMLGYLGYYDYTWYEFKLSQLPEGAIVTHEGRESSFLKPWSYIYPAINSFSILDGKYATRLQDQQRLVEYFEYTFYRDPLERLDTRALVLNCHTLERVAVDRKTGKASRAVEKITEENPVYKKACH